MLTIEQLREQHGPRRATLDIPELGEVLARRFTAQDYIRLSTISNTFEYFLEIVKSLLINEDGTPFFKPEDEYLLTENPQLVLKVGRELFDALGLDRATVKKNSEIVQSDSSPSDSASPSESSTQTT